MKMRVETKAKTKTTAKTETEASLFERLRLSAKGMRDKILNAITLAGRLISDVRGEWKIPDDVIRDLARLFLPAILKMNETEEGRANLTAWAEESKKRNEEKRLEGTTGDG